MGDGNGAAADVSPLGLIHSNAWALTPAHFGRPFIGHAKECCE
jgi:hypothetical protein